MAFLTLAFAVLLAIGFIVTGSFEFLVKDFWFSSGVLLLLFLSLVDQPHFPKDSSLFLNGVAGLFSLLTVDPTIRTKLWLFFFIWSIYLVASSYVLMLRRSRPLAQEPYFDQLISRINRSIGRPEALFSAFFLWGIYVRFSPSSSSYEVLMWYWAVFMILDLPAVSRTIADWIASLHKPFPTTVGNLTGFVSPRIIEAELTSGAPLVAVGRDVDILASSGVPCARATVIDDRILAGRRRVRMGIVSTTAEWSQLASNPPETTGIAFCPIAVDRGPAPVTVVDKGSDIDSVHLTVSPALQLNDGDLLWTLLPDGTRTHYQIVDARIVESSLGGDHGVHDLAVTAAQLGKWDPNHARFEAFTWVAPPGGLVFKDSPATDPIACPQGTLKVGSVPKSSFPIHVALEDTVTHNTAILGVTGSGKSFLSIRLVKGLVASGIKVLVLDITRQYWSILGPENPTQVGNKPELRAWLKSDSLLGIYQYAGSTNFTGTTAEFVEECLNHLSATITLRAGANEPAHLCIVFEEAHSLIPEWNQVAVRTDSDNVNKTARTMLQGRKYGMGCIVVSQRTANVTKTILNQCNTIFGFQCFDQTGLEFLRNYMGETYSQAISHLQSREAILVGKASSSNRPVRVSIDDFDTLFLGVPGAQDQ